MAQHKSKRKVIVIMGKVTDKPKLLGSDVTAKQILEAHANDVSICLYSATMDKYREIKRKSNGEALDALEKAYISTPLGYKAETYPIDFNEAGL